MPDMTPFIGYHFFHRAGRIGRAQAYAKIHRAMEDFSDQKAPILLSMMLDMRADNSGALVNYAAFLCGKVPVNLNYTLSEATIAACAKQCDIRTVITSRKFLEKIKLTPPGRLIYLEDVVGD